MISLIFMFINGAFKALSDLSSEGLIFPKSSSWENKWYMPHSHLIPNKKKLWYYLYLYAPQYKERFPYSSTFLVFLTDKWHLIESVRIFSVLFAIVGYKSFFLGVIADFVLLWGIRTIGFTLVYEYFKRKGR